MGRNKIDIQYIDDDRKRGVTLNKRKTGLIKKAYELSVLCGCEVAVVVRDQQGRSYLYGSNDPLSTFKRQLNPKEKAVEIFDNDAVRRKVECGSYDNDSGAEEVAPAPTKLRSGRRTVPRTNLSRSIKKSKNSASKRPQKNRAKISPTLTNRASNRPQRQASLHCHRKLQKAFQAKSELTSDEEFESDNEMESDNASQVVKMDRTTVDLGKTYNKVEQEQHDEDLETESIGGSNSVEEGVVPDVDQKKDFAQEDVDSTPWSTPINTPNDDLMKKPSHKGSQHRHRHRHIMGLPRLSDSNSFSRLHPNDEVLQPTLTEESLFAGMWQQSPIKSGDSNQNPFADGVKRRISLPSNSMKPMLENPYDAHDIDYAW